MIGKFGHFGSCIDRCESPIERLFLVGLLFLGDYTFEPFDRAPMIARDTTGVELGQQVKVDGYRLDFTLTHPSAHQRLAIELDGFEHHGSTPAQFERDAARQRAISARGWTVLRFSGREVRRDPRRCAEQAMLAAAALVPGAELHAAVAMALSFDDALARAGQLEAEGDVDGARALIRQARMCASR